MSKKKTNRKRRLLILPGHKIFVVNMRKRSLTHYENTNKTIYHLLTN